MTIPALELTHCCCRTFQGERKVPVRARFSLMAVDALVSITTFTLGIFGATGVIPMPLVAAYAFVGISSGITILYITACIKLATCPTVK